MSTPADTPLTFYRGAAWGHIFSFFQEGTDTPVDLTGLGPFVLEVRKEQDGPLLLSATYSAIDLVNGQIQLTATATQTLALPKPVSPRNPVVLRYAIRDGTNAAYAEAPAYVYPFTAAPT